MEEAKGGLKSENVYGGIQLGKRYRLNMSDLESNISVSLQYNFKPVNVNHSSTGKLRILDNDEAVVELHRDDGVIENFKGTSGSTSISGQDHECLLTFENGEFSIRKVTTSVLALKPVRSEVKFAGLNTAKSIAEARNIPQLLRKAVSNKDKIKKKAELQNAVSVDVTHVVVEERNAETSE